MTQILFSLCGMIFFTWLFQYLDFSFLNPIKIPFLKEYKFEGIISTFQMFTSIGAIFAFWYGYKRYERDKELNIIKELELQYDLIKEKDDIKRLINFWLKEYYFENKLYISNYWWKYISRNISNNIINIKDKDLDSFCLEILKMKGSPIGGDDYVSRNFYHFIIEKINKIISFLETNEREHLEIIGSFKEIEQKSLIDNKAIDDLVKKFSSKENIEKLHKIKKSNEEIILKSKTGNDEINNSLINIIPIKHKIIKIKSIINI